VLKLPIYCEGVGSWRTTTTTNPWGRKGTLPYTLACTVKSRPRTTSSLTTKRGKERERCLFLPELGCLATYVGYVPYVSLSRLGGGIHPTILHYLHLKYIEEFASVPCLRVHTASFGFHRCVCLSIFSARFGISRIRRSQMPWICRSGSP
jgi:hypothetical protein